MVESSKHELTGLLRDTRGNPGAPPDRFVEQVYDELRGVAAFHLRGRAPGQTLTPTVLVHEAYLRLIDQTEVDWQDRAHFVAIASRLMRRALLEHLRSKSAVKRGGDKLRVTFDEKLATAADASIDLLALEEALAALEKQDERKARVVELRFFGRLTMAETAEVLSISKKTVEADWYFARAWLSEALGDTGQT